MEIVSCLRGSTIKLRGFPRLDQFDMSTSGDFVNPLESSVVLNPATPLNIQKEAGKLNICPIYHWNLKGGEDTRPVVQWRRFGVATKLVCCIDCKVFFKEITS